jgi:hypothetical protein
VEDQDLESVNDPVGDLVPNEDGAHQNEEVPEAIRVLHETVVYSSISSWNINRWGRLGIAKNGIETLIHIK